MFSSKSEARKFAKSQILNLSPDDKTFLDEAIYGNVLQFLRDHTKEGDSILSFSADKYEPNLRNLEKDFPSLEFYYPRVVSETDLEFILPSNWKTGTYGLNEPADGRKMEPPFNFQWILLPSLGFSRSSGRLGRGKGYYDRALGHYPREKILGIAYEFLVGMDYPDEAHDLRPGGIITEKPGMGF